MASKCFSNVRGKVMRVTRMDECCEVVSSDCSTITTDGFVSVTYTAEIEEGEEYLLKNANGDVCVVDRGCPELKYYNLEIEFCQVDPELFELTTGQSLVYDWSGKAVGNDIGEKVKCDAPFGLELWTNIPGQECAAGQGKSYGYFLVPCVGNGILGDFTIENDVVTFSITGQSRSGHKWNRGPYDVESQNSGGTPGKLVTLLEPEKHLRLMSTTIKPPEPSCGCKALKLCDPDCDARITVAPVTTPDQDVVYTIEIENDGDCPLEVVSATITDSMNAQYEIVTKTASGATVTDTCNFSNNEIAPGATETCTVTFEAYADCPGVEVSARLDVEVRSLEGGSDGCSSQADATWELPDTAPVITITSPTAGTSVTQGTVVIFDASVVDDKDNDLDEKVRWESSIDGFIGEDEFATDQLSVGTHTVTATVTDSAGNAATPVTVTVTVT